MPYIPGENWAICDLSGKKVLMSQTRKTWDGLRVWAPLWYPRHPQLSLRGITERNMTVRDGRPRPADIFLTARYGWGSFCLISPNGTNYTIHMADDGAMLVTQDTWGTPQSIFYFDHYAFTVDDDGALHVADVGTIKGILSLKMSSVNRIGFNVTVDTDLAVLVSVISMPECVAGVTARDGIFTLVSPGGLSYVIYVLDDGTVVTALGTWGPLSTNFYLGDYAINVADDGVLAVALSGEVHPPVYRIVSPGGYEYMLQVDTGGILQVGREGHWWDVPSLVVIKPRDPYVEGTIPYTITEDRQDGWVAE